MKIELIAGWNKWYKFWSTRLGLVGTAIASLLIAYPNLALDLWSALPQEIKALIPPSYMPFIGVIMFVVSLASKFVVQDKLRKEIENNDTVNR